MRTFVIRAHDVPTEFGITLDNLPGNGRADLVARSIGTALLKSHGIRKDVNVIVSARGVAAKFVGSELGGLNPDERSIAGVLQSALQCYSDEWRESTPGVYSARKSFENVMQETDGTVYRLSSEGKAPGNVEIVENPVLVLSDHRDFTEEEISVLEGSREISVSPTELHTDQAVAVANNWLDTQGFSTFR